MSSQPPTKPSGDARATYRRAVAERFERACQADASTRVFQIAGRSLALHWASAALMPWPERSLSHLRQASAGTKADLDVLIWDEASTGVAAPPLPVRTQGHDTLSNDVQRMFGSDVHLSQDVKTQMLEYLDAGARLGACWLPSADCLTLRDWAAPLRRLLGAWAISRGSCLLSGSVLARGEQGVLLTGTGGSGRSTTAIAALGEGLELVGDDFVLIEPDHGLVRAHSLYCSLSITTAALERWARLSDWTRQRDRLDSGEKRVVWAREQSTAGAVIQALVIPRPGGAEVAQVRPASRLAVLRTLLPTSTLLLAGGNIDSAEGMAEIAQSLPAYELLLGTDSESNVAALSLILSGVDPTRSGNAKTPNEDAPVPFTRP